jgi:hypothetical protein
MSDVHRDGEKSEESGERHPALSPVRWRIRLRTPGYRSTDGAAMMWR